MATKPRLAGGIAWNAIGSFVLAICQWGMVAVLAKAAGPVEVGVFTLVGAIVTPLLVISQLQLRTVLVTDAASEFRFREYVWLRLISTTALVVLAPPAIALLTGRWYVVQVAIAFVLAKAFDSMADVFYGYHQKRLDMRIPAIGQIINGLLSLGLFGGVLALGYGLVAATVGYAIGSALAVLVWALPMTLRLRGNQPRNLRTDRRAVRRLLAVAAPLGIVSILAAISANLPRYQVEHVLGSYELGVFAAAAYVIAVGANLVTALGQAASPRWALMCAQQDFTALRRSLTRALLALAGLALLGTIASVFIGRQLLTVLYTADFARSTWPLVALAAAAIIGYPASIASVAATATRNFRQQIPIFVIALMAGVIVGLVAIPALGITGAALVTGVMAVVQLLGSLLVVRGAAQAFRRKGPWRVVHIVGAMYRAGVETWLMQLARDTDPRQIEFTFVKHSATESDYDAEILALGHRLVVVAQPRRPLRYLRRLIQVTRGADVVHSHVNHFSAVALTGAWLARVPVRVAHSHSDSRASRQHAGVGRRSYVVLTRWLINTVATNRLGSSAAACHSLFGAGSVPRARLQVLPTGIDLDAFAGIDSDLRQRIGATPDSVVIGQIGRLVAVKNHRWTLQVIRQLVDTGVDARLVIAGDGPLREDILAQAHAAGLDQRITMLGVRSDIPQILAGLDLMIMPSLYEGVPIIMLEAQASALPCVIADTIDDAAIVIPELINQLSLDADVRTWATVCGRIRQTAYPAKAECLHRMGISPYSLEQVQRTLRAIWRVPTNPAKVIP